jgi:hypothetical protein
MGVSWGKPKYIKDETIIVTLSLVPNPNDQDFWHLWKRAKTQIKDDGFNIKKDKKTEKWFISYNSENDSSWEDTLDEKVKKWSKLLYKLHNVFKDLDPVKEKTDINDVFDSMANDF